MDSRMRLTFACGTCLGLAVGFAAGHLSLWNRVPRQTVQRSLETELLGSDGFDLPAVLPQPDLTVSTPTPGGAVVLNDPDLGDEPVHADALVEMPEIPASAPSALSVDHAKPLQPVPSTSRTQQVQSLESEPLDPEVVNMLKEELQGVSEQQREVWARSSARDDSRRRDRCDLHVEKVRPDECSSQQFAATSVQFQPPRTRSSALSSVLKDLLPPAPAAALEAPRATDEASRIDAHNRANANTCGYLNLIPVQQELGLGSESGHHEAAGYRLDLGSVEIRMTGNPAHVAVQNRGSCPCS